MYLCSAKPERKSITRYNNMPNNCRKFMSAYEHLFVVCKHKGGIENG